MIIGKSVEVSGNNESLDTIFKGHILRLTLLQILIRQKIDQFLKLDKYGCWRQFSIFFANKDNARTGKQTSAMLINETHHSDMKTKTKTIHNFVFSFDQLSETKQASQTT